MTTVTAAVLEHDAQEFLRFKRAMGISYRRAEFVLNGFVHFVAQHWGDHGEVGLDDVITRWCARLAGRKAVTVANEFGVVRQLCLYRRRRDPSSYVPEHALVLGFGGASCVAGPIFLPPGAWTKTMTAFEDAGNVNCRHGFQPSYRRSISAGVP